MLKTRETAKAYEWDFDGACAPPEHGERNGYQPDSFTLGIFQWVPMNRSKLMKRGPVQERIKGTPAKKAEAYAAARDTVERFNREGHQQ